MSKHFSEHDTTQTNLKTAHPSVAVFFTGGTIAMRQLPGQGTVPVKVHEELSARIALAIPALKLEIVPWAELPSPHITPDHMLKLAHDVQAMCERPEIAGVVVCHGTDCMEESAFMLDIVLQTSKPVVFTGAMRSLDEEGYDGFRNLISAVRACLLPLMKDFGVTVFMADRLYAAREVTKMHSMSIDAFDSPGSGPLGVCVGGAIRLTRRPLRFSPLPVKQLERNVELISLAPGMDGKFIACARAHGAKALVIEGLGAGNVPVSAVDQVLLAVEAGLPVVLTSRCVEGGVWSVYGYTGGAANMHKHGVILGGGLSAQKARILLMAALGSKDAPASSDQPSSALTLDAIRGIFDSYTR